LLVRRKADRGEAASAACATDEAAAIDERIKHQSEKFVGELKRRALAASRGFAIKLCERICKRPAGQAKNVDEGRRQRGAGIKEIVECVGDVLLVLRKSAGADRTQRRRQVQEYAVAAVGQTVGKSGRQVGVGQAGEHRTAKPARGEDCVLFAEIAAGCKICVNRGAGQRRGAVHAGKARRYRIEIDDIERAGRKG
jgi:hypothetical protein